jgi:hypoxanthine phosphoribosyltransferase
MHHDLHQDIEEILIDEATLQRRIAELGADITRDYQGRRILLLGILKGAAMFLMDLARAIQLPLEIDFMAISSYGSATESSGVVRILKDLDEPIEGKDVLIVEDIIDSGLTLRYLLETLRSRKPASLRVCILLDKARERQHPLELDYVGFSIPNRFVVGYGLDYAQLYRNLPYIGVLKPEVYEGQ